MYFVYRFSPALREGGGGKDKLLHWFRFREQISFSAVDEDDNSLDPGQSSAERDIESQWSLRCWDIWNWGGMEL